MKVITEKQFDSVKYFKLIKEKLASKMDDMSLEDQKKFMQQVREGKIKIA